MNASKTRWGKKDLNVWLMQYPSVGRSGQAGKCHRLTIFAKKPYITNGGLSISSVLRGIGLVGQARCLHSSSSVKYSPGATWRCTSRSAEGTSMRLSIGFGAQRGAFQTSVTLKFFVLRGAWTARKAASLPSMPIWTKVFIPSEWPGLPAAPTSISSIPPCGPGT